MYSDTSYLFSVLHGFLLWSAIVFFIIVIASINLALHQPRTISNVIAGASSQKTEVCTSKGNVGRLGEVHAGHNFLGESQWGSLCGRLLGVQGASQMISVPFLAGILVVAGVPVGGCGRFRCKCCVVVLIKSVLHSTLFSSPFKHSFELPPSVF